MEAIAESSIMHIHEHVYCVDNLKLIIILYSIKKQIRLRRCDALENLEASDRRTKMKGPTLCMQVT